MSASPTCTTPSGFITITSCTFASSILTINLGTISATLSSATFNASTFVNPSTALDQWPSTGGFQVVYSTSGGTIINNFGSTFKLTGFEATTLTAASIANLTSSFDTIGDTAAQVKVSITPLTTVPSTGYITIIFPTEEVSGDPTCSTSGVICTGDGTVFKSNPNCIFSTSTNTLTITNVV